MSDNEREIALREAHEIASEEEFFEARPKLDTVENRRIFDQAFTRGWEESEKRMKELGK